MLVPSSESKGYSLPPAMIDFFLLGFEMTVIGFPKKVPIICLVSLSKTVTTVRTSETVSLLRSPSSETAKLLLTKRPLIGTGAFSSCSMIVLPSGAIQVAVG